MRIIPCITGIIVFLCRFHFLLSFRSFFHHKIFVKEQNPIPITYRFLIRNNAVDIKVSTAKDNQKNDNNNIITTYDINDMIIKSFDKQSMKSDSDITRLYLYLSEHRELINQINVKTLFHRCSKNQVNPLLFMSESTIIQNLDPNQVTLSAADFISIINTFTFIPKRSKTFQEMISLYCKHLEKNQNCFNLRLLANIIYALRYYRQEDTIVGRLLEVVDKKFCETMLSIDSKDISAKSLSSICNGLQGFSSIHPYVRSILGNVSKLMNKCPEPFNGMDIVNTMFGLRSSYSDHVEVVEVVHALCNNIEKYESKYLDDLSLSKFTSMIFGMHDLSSSHPCTQRLLKILVDYLDKRQKQNHPYSNSYFYHPHHPYDNNNDSDRSKHLPEISSDNKESNFVGNTSKDSIYNTNYFKLKTVVELRYMIGGLHSMSTNDNYVRRLIFHMISWIPSIYDENWMNLDWDEISISNCYFDLQSLHSNHPESLELLLKLTKTFQRTNVYISPGKLAKALKGLQHMSADKNAVKVTLRYFLSHFNSYKYPSSRNSSDSHNNNLTSWNGSLSSSSPRLYLTSIEIAYACFGLQSMSEDQSGAVRAILHSLVGFIENSPDSLNNIQFGQSIFGFKSMVSSEQSGVIRMLYALYAKWDTKNTDSNISASVVKMIIQGLRGMGSEYEIIQNILWKLKSKIESSRYLTFSGRDYSIIFHSLHDKGGMIYPKNKNTILSVSRTLGFGILSNSITRRRLLPIKLQSFLDAIADKFEMKEERLTTSFISSSLYGFQGMTSDTPVVRRILRVLTKDLALSTDYMDAQNIGNAFYGLQNMSCKHEEVQDLVNTLAQGVEKSMFHVNTQSVANSLYGFQFMSSEYPQVRRAIEAIAIKIDNMPSYHPNQNITMQKETIFTGQNIGNALWGLRNMTSDYPEVRHILRSLSVKIRESPVSLNGQNIGNALYGLHAMNHDDIEVKEILAALAHKIVISDTPLSSLDVGMALYGLNAKDHSSPEVRVILGALIHKLKNSETEFQLKELSLAIVGILKSSPWIREDFLKVLASKTPGIKTTFENESVN